MSDKFLNTGGSNINISNGTTTLFGSSIGAISLDPSQPVKTNSVRQLISSKLDIADITNLRSELNQTVKTPYIGDIKATDFETDNYFSINDELQKIDNFAAATAGVTNIGGLINSNEISCSTLYDTTQSTFIELDSADINIACTNFTVNGVPVGSGDVVGPAGAVDGTLARFDGATGKLIKESAALLGSEVTMLNTGGTAFTTSQQAMDIFGSSGFSSGGNITDNLDGTVAVGAGKGFIRANPSSTDPLYFAAWSAIPSLALTNFALNYIYVDWGAGNPTVLASTTIPDNYTQFTLGTVYRINVYLHITNPARNLVADHANLTAQRTRAIQYITREANGGAILTETGTRNIAITTGNFWIGLTRYTTAAFDSSTVGEFTYYFDQSNYTETIEKRQIDNLRYDNNGSLTALGNSQYGVHWVYIGADSAVYIVYGTASYLLAQANEAEAPAVLPAQFEKHAILIAKIIIQKSATTFTSITSAFRSSIGTGVAGVNQVNGTGTDNAICRFDTNGNTIQNSGVIIDDTTAIVPVTTAVSDLGTSGIRFRNLYLNNNANIQGDLVLATTNSPLAADTGATGSFRWDSDYLYICVATDTWKRVNLSSYAIPTGIVHPMNFTSATLGGYVVTWSNNDASSEGWRLFDSPTTGNPWGITSAPFASLTKFGVTANQEWMQLDLGSDKEIINYTFQVQLTGRGPGTWFLYGSSDGTTWNQIDTQTGQTWATNEVRQYILSTPTTIRYIGFSLRAVETSNTFVVYRMQFEGNPVY